MAGTSSDDSSPKREAILDAALELFAQRGFHGTAVPLVAERARVGAGTVYRYFESKEALVNVLYRRWKAAFAEALTEDFPAEATVRAQFAELWRRMHRFATRHPTAVDFLEAHFHGSYLDPESQALEAKLFEPVRCFVEGSQQKEALKPGPPELFIALVWGAYTGLWRTHRAGRLPLTRDQLDLAENCLWEALRR